MKLEWVIVKGVSHFTNDHDPPNNLWKSFACTMAASLVSNMLNDALVFKDWPHFDGKFSSAWFTALYRINPVCQKRVGIDGRVYIKRVSTLLPFVLVTGCVRVVQYTQAILNEGFYVLM